MFVARQKRVAGVMKSFRQRTRGVLLYLQKTHYIQPDDAVAAWNAGNLDALVVSMEKAAGLVPQLSGTVSRSKTSEQKEEEGRGYVLIVR
jgi:hypothetical protein